VGEVQKEDSRTETSDGAHGATPEGEGDVGDEEKWKELWGGGGYKEKRANAYEPRKLTRGTRMVWHFLRNIPSGGGTKEGGTRCRYRGRKASTLGKI